MGPKEKLIGLKRKLKLNKIQIKNEPNWPVEEKHEKGQEIRTNEQENLTRAIILTKHVHGLIQIKQTKHAPKINYPDPLDLKQIECLQLLLFAHFWESKIG